MTNKFKDLFISYGRHESLGFVARLHQEIKLAGYDGWFDKVNIPDGDDYAQCINHGIESAHNFVYVMAPRCMTSPYCLIELEYARLLGKRLIPINQMVIFNTPEQQLSAEDQQVLVNFYNRYNLPDQNIHTTKDVLNRSHALVGTTDWLDAKQNLSDEDCKKLYEWKQEYENNWAKHDDLDYLKTAKLPIFGQIIDAIKGVVERITAVLDRETDYVHRHTEILADALHWQKNQKASVHLLVGKERTAAELWLLTKFLPPKQPPCQASTLLCEFICEARKNAENLMTDIFICYDIHHDKAIIDNVIQSLSRYAKTTWTHDRDIQKRADDEGVIDVGIENADNFFYFISPSSVASEYCQRELAHALQYNKRIAPLLIVPTSNIPESLIKLQFIDLTGNTSTNNYDSHIDDILNILRQDEEYYKQHKILLARAIEWQTKNQKPSFLLRGHNLDNAKTWLRLNDKREQHSPLPLHQQLITASEAAKGQLNTEVFISYSRKDSDFARRLNTALQEAGKTTWFDQESISTGVDFEKEIFKGINGTDNFLFVLSPDSVESEYCESEVNHAVSQNKRFISVLHREIEPKTQPEALEKIEWIDFKDSAFDKSFPELVQAIELDREHAHKHTVLQQRATDWDENNQSSDFLLNTTACSNAEQWLRTAKTKAKKPEPTELQQDFIQQSRQAIVAAEAAVTKRRKITFAATTIGLFFAFLLTIFAFIEMNTANEHLHAVKARLYHAKAQTMSETNPLLALRLAEKAREFDLLSEMIDKTLQDIYAHEDLGSSFPYKSIVLPNGERNNLLLATSEIGKEFNLENIASEWDVQRPLLMTLSGHLKELNFAAFSPDGTLIVTASNDETAKVWDVQGKLLATLSGHQSYVNSAAFSPDGALIVTASWDGTAKVWDVQGNLQATLSGHLKELNSAAFSPDGALIVTASDDDTAKVWDVQGNLQATLSGHWSSVNSAAFSPNGALIVTASSDSTAKVWDVQGNLQATLSGLLRSGVNSAAFSPDGALIVTASSWDGTTAKVWDVQGNLQATLSGYQANINSAAFSPDGALIVTASDDKTAKVWDVQGNLQATLSGHVNSVTSAAFSPDGAFIVTASSDGTAKVWDVQVKLVPSMLQDKAHFMTLSPNQQRIVTTYDDNTAKVWNRQGKLLAILEHQEPVKFAVFSQDSSQIKTTTQNTVNVWRNSFVDDFLKSEHLPKLTVAEQIFAEVLTLEDVSRSKDFSDNILNIAKFYEDKAEQSYITEVKRKYLQQAATLYQRSGREVGKAGKIKLKLANLALSDSTANKRLVPTYEPSIIMDLANIPIVIFMGLLMLIVSGQQKFFFQNRQYLQLSIYSIITVVGLVVWFSFRDGFYDMILRIGGENIWLFIDVVIASLVAGICFFHVRKSFQHKVLRTSLQIFCLVIFILLIGYLVNPGIPMTTVGENKLLVVAAFLTIVPLLPIPLTYYALQPSGKWWKWLLKKGSMLVVYTIFFCIIFVQMFLLDSAIAVYNPIPTNLRFLLLLVAVIVLVPALWSQFYAYMHPQRKWLIVLGLMGVLACTAVYSSILYLSLMAFWDYGVISWFVVSFRRMLLIYEISDALTLLLTIIASGFAIFWAVNGYWKQNYIKSGIYILLALFLVSSTIFYFRAYMSMLPFLTVVIGGMLLFIHAFSTGFDKKPQLADK